MSEVYQSLSHSKWDCEYHVVFVPIKVEVGNGGTTESITETSLAPVRRWAS